MKHITYYVKILLEDTVRFWEYVYNLNEDTDQRYHVVVIDVWRSDRHLTFSITGTRDSYECFLSNKTFVESVDIYESDEV